MGMELAALALVNVVTALAMYLFFSMRFSRAVRQTIEESRKNSLLRELKENVELTIEYINSSLDTMDQKTRSFYQLLRRSEELVETLTELQANAIATASQTTSGPSTRGAKKKSAAARGKAKAPAGKQTGSKAKSQKAAVSSAKSARTARAPARPPAPADIADDLREQDAFAAPPKTDGANYNVDRVLADVGADRLEISQPAGSVESAYRSGELSRPRDETRSAQPVAAGGGLFLRVGQVALRILGIDSLPNAGTNGSGNPDSPATAAAVESAPVPRQRFEIPELPPERVPGESGLLPRLPEARNAAESASVFGGEPRQRSDYFDRGAGDASAGRGGSANPGAGYGPAFSMQPELPPPAEILRAEGLVGRMEAGEAGRREVIRTLLRYGYRPAEIARATGIALPQVELVAALPDGGPRPRRQRLASPGES